MTNSPTRVLRWIAVNLGLTIALTLAGMTFGVIYQAGEINGHAYSIITDNWSKLSPASQQNVARVLAAHGKIRQWDYNEIFDSVMNDTHGFVMPQTDYDAQAARELLIHAVRSSRSTASGQSG